MKLRIKSKRNMFKKTSLLLIVSVLSFVIVSCTTSGKKKDDMKQGNRIPLILDTDANNELDDQHAIAYMLFNQDYFDVRGITVNETYNGGSIEKHLEEAQRVVDLCGYNGQVSVIPGASGNYRDILPSLNNPGFDGQEAVDFIIEEARNTSDGKLVLVPIGKLTNIALALAKAPDISEKVKVVWLGSNWPEKGEYNLENDTSSLTPLLENPDLEFEILTVRYGKPSGTWAVNLSVDEVREKMKGLGPEVDPVAGRYGGTFSCFGDYSVELYEKSGDDRRALYDVCTLILLKYPGYAEKVPVKGPGFDGTDWNRSGNPDRVVYMWENFKKDKIINEFYNTMEKPDQ